MKTIRKLLALRKHTGKGIWNIFFFGGGVIDGSTMTTGIILNFYSNVLDPSRFADKKQILEEEREKVKSEHAAEKKRIWPLTKKGNIKV